MHSTARPVRESTCSISLTCQTKNSAMPSTPPPWSRFVKHRRSQRLPSAKKAGHIKSMPVRLRLQIPLLDEPRPLSASLSARSAKADGKPPAPSPVRDRPRAKLIKADLMSRHVPLLRWTQKHETRPEIMSAFTRSRPVLPEHAPRGRGSCLHSALLQGFLPADPD